MANYSLCALLGKRQWFIVVTKGRSRLDSTFHLSTIVFLFIFKLRNRFVFV